MSKGQVTLFIIVGIVLITIISLALMLMNNSKKEIQIPKESSTHGRIEGLIKSCATNLLPKSARYLAATSFRPKEVQNMFMTLPYHYIHGVILLPSKQTIENDLGDYISEQITFCVNNFEEIPSDEEIILGNPLFTTEVFLAENQITIDVQPNITLITKTGEQKVSSLGLSFENKLGAIYKSSEYVVNYLGSNSFCLVCLQNYLDERGLYGEVSLGYKENELIFFFADYYPQDKGSPLETRFAVMI